MGSVGGYGAELHKTIYYEGYFKFLCSEEPLKSLMAKPVIMPRAMTSAVVS